MFSKVFEPLFKMCDMEIDITMSELYKRTNIKFNIFVTNLDRFVLEKDFTRIASKYISIRCDLHECLYSCFI